MPTLNSKAKRAINGTLKALKHLRDSHLDREWAGGIDDMLMAIAQDMTGPDRDKYTQKMLVYLRKRYPGAYCGRKP